MTKRKKQAKRSVKKIEESSMSPWLLHGLAVVTFLLISVAFFYPQLQGKVITQSDIVSYSAASQEQHRYEEEEGRLPLWTNSMFSGMPTYQIGIRTPGNRTLLVEKAFNLFLNRPIGYFIAMMIGFYIMCLSLGMSPLVAIIGSVVFSFTVNHFVLFEAGHTAKLRAFAFFGIILSGIVNAYRGKYLLGATLFAVGMACEIGVNHIQMSYYLAMSLLVYLGFLLYRDIKANNMKGFMKASGFLLLALILAVSANTSRLWTSMEYAQETMRGKPVLATNEVSAASSSSVDGLAWDYAMQWSNGALDLMTYLVPGIVGGGSREPVNSDSEFARLTNQSGDNIGAPLYWGSLPFTSGPSYVGAVVLFLFLLGAITVKGDLKWWLVSTTILTLLLSMGSNFEFFNKLFFNYFPLYSKFRTPNSIASITEFLMVLMATWTLSEIVKGAIEKAAINRGVMIAAGVSAGICLLLAILGPSLFSFSSPGDARYDPRIAEALVSDRKSLLQMDAFRSLVLIILGAGLILAHNRNKIKSTVLLAVISAIIVFDIWGVGRRYLNEYSFVRKNQSEQALSPRQVDQLIGKDQDLHFRVHDLSVNSFNSSIPSYHHKMIGGYHAAKLQRYQDIIDYYLAKGSVPVMSMLNTKYIIDSQGQLQVNAQAYGNAWFVNKLEMVGTANEEIEALETIDLATVAVVHEEFGAYIEKREFTPNGGIELTSYHPERLEYKTNSTSDQFAVFSEVWYGPDKGWNAYIDDQQVEFIRTDYVLRGMKVPAGGHVIRFEFKPKAFYLGEVVSNISSLLILAFVALFIFHQFKPLPFLKRIESRKLA